MKPGVILVNTARGGLVRSADLLWGLEKNIIASAGLDVLESENLMEDPCLFATHSRTHEETQITLMNNLLIDHPRTIVTPHNAFNTTEAVMRIIEIGTNNIKQFQHNTPENSVIPYL
jgi:D-lactate dehydrogenase